jgi:Single Cache domain 2
MRRYWLTLTLAVLLATPGQAQQSRDFGSPEEAMMMLQRVIGAMRADEARALQLFNQGAPGFREADLYPYCCNAEGVFTAHPDLLGTSMRDVRDKRGNPLGQLLYDKAREGEINRVAYFWPRPGATEILQKVALVTRIGDQVCAVGYYRPGHRGKEAIP